MKMPHKTGMKYWGLMPLTIALMGFILLHVPSPNKVSAAENNGMEWVRQSFDAPSNLSYIGEIETMRFASLHAEATIVRIEHRAPDFTRRWYLAPPSLYGDSVVIHDHRSYEFDEQHHMLIESLHQWNDDAVHANRELLLGKNFRVISAGTGLIAGRHVKRVNLLQRSTGHRLVSLAIDSETNLPLQRETYRADGSIAYRMRFTSIRYISRDRLPLTVFSTAAPSGFRILEKNSLSEDATPSQAPHVAEATPSLPPVLYSEPPTNLPQGFHLLRSTNTSVGGVSARQWVYTDGVRSLSLFASPLDHHPIFRGLHPRTVTVDGKPANFVEEGSDALLSWPTEHRILTLVGDLTAEELVNIAEHIDK